MDGRRAQLQRFFLDRLDRMSWLAGEPVENQTEAVQSQLSGEARRHLIFRAIFSTYLDCKEHGKEAEARSILGKSPLAESFRQAFE